MRGLAHAALVLAALEGSAHAYCRTRTCNPQRDLCSADPLTSCVTTGLETAWRRPCLSFSLDTSNLRLNQVDPILQIVTRAFETWTSVQCPTTNEPPHLTFRHEWGPVLCGHVEYNSAQGNANVVTFRNEWPYFGAGNELGRTTVTYSIDTGEILDADIEINNEIEFSTADEVPAASFDLQSVLTHEIGHFLGLAHSNAGETVMLVEYREGSNYRSLRADDIDAVCDIYGPLDPSSICDFAPVNGFSAECAFDPGSGGWCSAEPSRLPGRGAHLALFVGIVLGAVVLRRRNRRRT